MSDTLASTSGVVQTVTYECEECGRVYTSATAASHCCID